MRKNIILLLCLLSINTTFAQDHAELSAHRDLEVDYSLYQGPIEKTAVKRSPLNTAKLYNEVTLPKATSWASIEVMQSRFESLREDRFLIWKVKPEAQRRLTWFYPDDGCFARASLAMRSLFRLYAPLASKVFAFGNLRVKTKNSPRGAVGWWFHVAPIVEVKGVKYVLDPSIEFGAPLTLKDWLTRMGNPAKMKVSICNSGAYAPSSNCDKKSDGIETRAEIAEQHYLGLEWKRMVELKREHEL